MNPNEFDVSSTTSFMVVHDPEDGADFSSGSDIPVRRPSTRSSSGRGTVLGVAGLFVGAVVGAAVFSDVGIKGQFKNHHEVVSNTAPSQNSMLAGLMQANADDDDAKKAADKAVEEADDKADDKAAEEADDEADDKAAEKADDEDESESDDDDDDTTTTTPAGPTCSMGTDNCNVTKCCATPGMQCYQQDGLYAQCRSACNTGPIPTHWDPNPWSCQTLGDRTPGESKCSGPGESCLESKCCAQAGTQCFKKNDGWATCKSECFAGAPDITDENSDPWACEKLGDFTPGAQGWVWQKCAKEGESCAASKCCLGGDQQCYTQSGPVDAPFWAQCKQHCAPGQKANPWEQGWECKEVGSRTPGAPPKGGKIAKWAAEECSDFGESCAKSKCCLGMDATCYEKNDKWATCKTSCTKGKDPNDNNETWTCNELGPKGYGLAVKGSPALYCFSLTRTSGYEVTVMQGQLNNSIGIFACDLYDVFSADGVMSLGKDADGREIKTEKVKPAVIKTTMDGTAGNAKLFVHVWDKVLELNKWRNAAWTVKADPDAVLIPERIRWHVAAHTGEKVYVLNCNKFPQSPNFPMMFGSVEIFAFHAMEAYSYGHTGCTDSMGEWLESWGEDYYMGKCMDLIKVGRISDYSVVGDAVCTGADCNNPGVASFHPFKSWDAWSECHQKAVKASDKR